MRWFSVAVRLCVGVLCLGVSWVYGAMAGEAMAHAHSGGGELSLAGMVGSAVGGFLVSILLRRYLLPSFRMAVWNQAIMAVVAFGIAIPVFAGCLTLLVLLELDFWTTLIRNSGFALIGSTAGMLVGEHWEEIRGRLTK